MKLDNVRSVKVVTCQPTHECPHRSFQVEVQYGKAGIDGALVLPFSSKAGARVVADYIRCSAQVPEPSFLHQAAGVMAYEQAGNRDIYVPASGGLERPFLARNGRRVVYCYNRLLDRHAYLDLDADRILEQFELSEYGLA